MQKKVDVITVEVVRNYLANIAEEVKKTIIRTSMSPIIYEVLDFSTGVFSRQAKLIAQASGLAIFLGTLDWAVEATLKKYGEEGLYPDDIIITNDPYAGGGTHLNDVAMVKPVFHSGNLVAFVGVRAHWLDIGGKVAFSQMTDASEIYQEGLQFPIIKLAERGRLNEMLLETIKANVREPRFVIGDMKAQIASCKVGEMRFIELLEKYGADTVYECIERMMADSEKAARQALTEIPDGVYEGEDFLDNDCVTDEPRRIKVKVEKRGDDITFDFRGTDPGTRSSYNMGYCALVSASRVILKAITAPHAPMNDGSFRPLKVVVEEGTMICAKRPSAVCMYGEVAERVVDAVWKALAGVVPQLLAAGHYGTVCAQGLAGYDDRFDPPRYAMHGGPNAGGWGASDGKDGENALICVLNGDTRNTPCEIIEAKNPLVVKRYELREDSGGPGKFRGGLGTTIEYEVTTGLDYVGVFLTERAKFRPFGIEGGKDAVPNSISVTREGKVMAGLNKVTGMQLFQGDLVTVSAGGGGGYGDPFLRPPERVLEDVRQGYVTLEGAEREYGVRVNTRDMAIDWDETRHLRGGAAE